MVTNSDLAQLLSTPPQYARIRQDDALNVDAVLLLRNVNLRNRRWLQQHTTPLRGGRHGVLAGFHVLLTEDLSQDCEEDIAIDETPLQKVHPVELHGLLRCHHGRHYLRNVFIFGNLCACKIFA